MSDAAAVASEPPATVPAEGATDRPGRFAGRYPVLLAAYPVLFLWSQNLGETHVRDVVRRSCPGRLAAASAPSWLAGRCSATAARAALIVTPAVIGVLMYGHVANLVGPLHVRALVQQAGWAASWPSRSWRPSRLRRRAHRHASTRALTRIVDRPGRRSPLVLDRPLAGRRAALVRGPVGTSAPLATDTAAPRRDVYWLVFDRYGSDRAPRTAVSASTTT